MDNLKQKHSSRLVFDPTYIIIDVSIFKNYYWKDLYGDAEEVIPPKALKPRGKVTDMKAKVDSYHAGDKENRRSRTGYLIFCNISLVDWMYKKQPTIETSVFGAEFVAFKHVMEAFHII